MHFIFAIFSWIVLVIIKKKKYFGVYSSAVCCDKNVNNAFLKIYSTVWSQYSGLLFQFSLSSHRFSGCASLKSPQPTINGEAEHTETLSSNCQALSLNEQPEICSPSLRLCLGRKEHKGWQCVTSSCYNEFRKQ